MRRRGEKGVLLDSRPPLSECKGNCQTRWFDTFPLSLWGAPPYSCFYPSLFQPFVTPEPISHISFFSHRTCHPWFCGHSIMYKRETGFPKKTIWICTLRQNLESNSSPLWIQPGILRMVFLTLSMYLRGTDLQFQIFRSLTSCHVSKLTIERFMERAEKLTRKRLTAKKGPIFFPQTKARASWDAKSKIEHPPTKKTCERVGKWLPYRDDQFRICTQKQGAPMVMEQKRTDISTKNKLKIRTLPI